MDLISHSALVLLVVLPWSLPVTAAETRATATIPQYVIDYGEYCCIWELAR